MKLIAYMGYITHYMYHLHSSVKYENRLLNYCKHKVADPTPPEQVNDKPLPSIAPGLLLYSMRMLTWH